jgi:hypothetical protein
MHQPLRNEEEEDFEQHHEISTRRRCCCGLTNSRCCRFCPSLEKKHAKLIFLLLVFIFSFFSFRYGWQTSPCWSREDELEFLVPEANPWPLRNAHSHNDYQQTQPLREALMAGFCAMEGDVFLRKGVLYLGHMFNVRERKFFFVNSHSPKVIGTITLEETYLIPLIKLIADNDGLVYKRALRLGDCLQVTLLVDIKSVETVVETWQLLEDMLARLDVGLPNGNSIFETVDKNSNRKSTFPSPIRVVVTGISGAYLEIARLMKLKDVRKTFIDLNSETDSVDALMVRARAA